MNFEELARFAFNDCKKYDDPWSISAQERHIVFSDSKRVDEAKIMLGKVFVGLLLRVSDYRNELLKLENQIAKCNKQEDFNNIIMKSHLIMEKHLEK